MHRVNHRLATPHSVLEAARDTNMRVTCYNLL